MLKVYLDKISFFNKYTVSRELEIAWTNGRLNSRRFADILNKAFILSAESGAFARINVTIFSDDKMVIKMQLRTRQEFARVYADVYAKGYHEGAGRAKLIRTMTIAD